MIQFLFQRKYPFTQLFIIDITKNCLEGPIRHCLRTDRGSNYKSHAERTCYLHLFFDT